MSHPKINILLLCAAVSLGGCATVTTGTRQSFEVLVQGADSAHCVVQKPDFGPLNITPGKPASIPRGDVPLSVQCDQEGFQSASLVVDAHIQSRAKYELPFGMFIDYLSGARYAYPAQVTMTMTPLQNAVSVH